VVKIYTTKKQLKGVTNFMQIGPGPFHQNMIWAPGHNYIDEDVFWVFENIIEAYYPTYDHYEFDNDIPRETMKEIIAELVVVEALAAYVDNKALAGLLRRKYFTDSLSENMVLNRKQFVSFFHRVIALFAKLSEENPITTIIGV